MLHRSTVPTTTGRRERPYPTPPIGRIFPKPSPTIPYHTTRGAPQYKKQQTAGPKARASPIARMGIFPNHHLRRLTILHTSRSRPTAGRTPQYYIQIPTRIHSLPKTTAYTLNLNRASGHRQQQTEAGITKYTHDTQSRQKQAEHSNMTQVAAGRAGVAAAAAAVTAVPRRPLTRTMDICTSSRSNSFWN